MITTIVDHLLNHLFFSSSAFKFFSDDDDDDHDESSPPYRPVTPDIDWDIEKDLSPTQKFLLGDDLSNTNNELEMVKEKRIRKKYKAIY